MSLIGSLEDLGLGDILQIIHLSQKSGVLSIRGDAGEGRIVFQDGLVRLASLKGDPEDLRGLLVDRGFVAEANFEAATRAAHESGGPLATALSNHASIQIERIESLRRECAESAVGEMFSWTTGEFSFDVGAEEEFIDGDMSLATGVNAQYLAMESLRVRDEGDRSDAPTDASTLPAVEAEVTSSTLNLDLSAEEMFGVVDETDQDKERVSEALIEVSQGNSARAEFISIDAPEAPFAEVEAVAELEAVGMDEPKLEVEEPPEVALQSAAVSTENLPPVVVIDPQLAVLEWVRNALSGTFPSVHIFQRSQEGLGRIRQYLARAQAPILLVAPGIEGNPLSGIADAADFVQRLRDQAPRMPILWLIEEDAQSDDRVPVPLPTVVRPSAEDLSGGAPAEALAQLAQKVALGLLEQTARLLAPAATTPASGTQGSAPGLQAESAEDLERLKEATQALSDASTRSDILPLVIRFAGEIFSRVAMFMVRGDQVIGMAQLGIESIGGPDDVEMRALQFERGESSWFSEVIETGRPLSAPARNGGDQRFCELIGGSAHSHAYVAPILSAEKVVALLYADNGSNAVGPADTSALEVVLHHAGLALDRAALELALAESDD